MKFTIPFSYAARYRHYKHQFFESVTFAEMLRAADDSLYRAKANGRNQVVETTT